METQGLENTDFFLVFTENIDRNETIRPSRQVDQGIVSQDGLSDGSYSEILWP